MSQKVKRHFPLFQSPLELAHHYWERLLQEGDFAIDATCGNGNDTLKLAQILEKKGVAWGIIGIDIQEAAIQATRELLQTQLSPFPFSKIHLFQQSHADFPPLSARVPIRLIVYNLGYLPRGNKQMTTMTVTTLQSVEKALILLAPGGALSITCYPGHLEGAIEEKALIQRLSQLPAAEWSVCFHTFSNRKAAPSLLLIQKM